MQIFLPKNKVVYSREQRGLILHPYSALCAIKASLNNIDQNEKDAAIDLNIIHEKGCTTNMDLEFSLCCERSESSQWMAILKLITEDKQIIGPADFHTYLKIARMFLQVSSSFFSPLTDFRLFRHRLGLLYWPKSSALEDVLQNFYWMSSRFYWTSSRILLDVQQNFVSLLQMSQNC